MVRWVLVLVSALALASPARAAWNSCGAPGVSTAVGAILTPKVGHVCHDTAAATATDSDLLTISGCDHISIAFDPAGASTNTGADAYIYSCTAASVASAWCRKLLVDTDGDGIPDDVTLDGTTLGRKGQQWQNADWLYVDMVTAPSGTDVSRTMISCH